MHITDPLTLLQQFKDTVLKIQNLTLSGSDENIDKFSMLGSLLSTQAQSLRLSGSQPIEIETNQLSEMQIPPPPMQESERKTSNSSVVVREQPAQMNEIDLLNSSRLKFTARFQTIRNAADRIRALASFCAENETLSICLQSGSAASIKHNALKTWMKQSCLPVLVCLRDHNGGDVDALVQRFNEQCSGKPFTFELFYKSFCKPSEPCILRRGYSSRVLETEALV